MQDNNLHPNSSLLRVWWGGLIAALREVRPIAATLIGATVASLWWRRGWLSGLFLTLLAWVGWFFRDPPRAPERTTDDVILAPADGRVTDVAVVDEPLLFGGSAQRITIFLSIFDVHVQRAPYAGTVEQIIYEPGGFAPAFLPSANRNERNFVALRTARGPLGVTQVAGILARRIVCWTNQGAALTRGERFGLVKFGSRSDLYLPLDAQVTVERGQQVYAGQTCVARWSGNA